MRSRSALRKAPEPVFTVTALQNLSERIHSADCLETLVDSILAGLDESFGFRHSMIAVPSEQDGVLVTIATRGYAENGAGAEIRHGEGICGLVAEARKPIRISGLLRGMLYALAMHKAQAGRAAVTVSPIVYLRASSDSAAMYPKAGHCASFFSTICRNAIIA